MTTGADRPELAAVREIFAGIRRPDGDVVGLLQRISRAAASELSASGAGVSMMTGDGTRGICAASDERSERVEELQFVLGEGPCVDAYTGRRPVLTADLSGAGPPQWPVYRPAAQQEGVRAVFAFPLQSGTLRLGVLDIFRDHPGELTSEEIDTALVFADVTVETLLAEQEPAPAPVPGTNLDVGNRAHLFQAQGMVMVQLGVTIGEAMARLRGFAYAENRRLDDVAHEVVNRTLRFHPDQPDQSRIH